MRALILDDSRAIRTILRQMLISLGFDVIEAGDGAEGLRVLAQSGGADLALVDWNMPVMNGLEFLRDVRRHPACDEMRVVMVTTESEMDRMVQAIEEGANEYIMKPFTKDVVQQKLEMLGMAIA